MAESRRNEDVALAYIATFAGRDDAYSPWVATDEGGQWIARREPLTPRVVIDAFRRKRPIGAYISTVPDAAGKIGGHLACLDVDLEPGGLRIADRIARSMRKTGIPAYLEPSRRGAHVWVVMSGRLPAPVIRRALRALMTAADVEQDPKIELRPGQDHLSGPDALGNALRMPLMPHQRTGVAGELMEPGGRLVASTVSEAVLNIDYADPAIVSEWAQRWVVEPEDIPVEFRRQRPYRKDDGASVVEILAQIGVRAVPGRAIRCPFHEDRNPSLSIARDEKRVFCKSPTCDASNGGRGLGTDQLRSLIGKRAAA